MMRCSLPRAGAVLATVVALAVVAPAASTTATTGARAVVQAVIDDGLVILRKGDLSIAAKRVELQKVVEMYFDFETLSKLVLAQNWRKMSKPQRQAFVAVFKTHLSLTYSKNIEQYNNEVPVITGEKEEARGDRTVTSKIVRSGQEDIFVSYRMRDRAGKWMMIDVVVEGVSLVSNWRSQFREVLGNKSPEHLIELLHEKNEKMQQEA